MADNETNLLAPSTGLLVKLGSLIIHYQEFTSPNSAPHDLAAIHSLQEDPEVYGWLRDMTEAALLPLKRD